MTQFYADHDTAADLNRDIKRLPGLFAAGKPVDDPREDLIELANTLHIEEVKELLRLARARNPIVVTA
jgi:hypothetical protein